MSEHRRFLAWFALFLALLGLVPALNYLLLWQAGELIPLRSLVRLQHERNAVYGTGLHDNRREHRIEIIRRRQPEVVALGSSTVIDMRQEYFTLPFACACQAMDSIDDGEVFVDAMLRVAKPKLVLFGLDFWWFTTRRPQLREPLRLDDTVHMTRSKLMRPTDWLRDGTLSGSDYLRLLHGDRQLSAATSHPKLGVMAIKLSLGIRADGSEMSGIRLTSEAFRFYAKARAEIAEAGAFVLRNPGTRYGPDNVLVPERMAALRRVLERLDAAGAKTVLFLPPVAPPLVKAMAASGRHGYLRELDRQLAALGVEYYNFHDPATLGAADLCEFADHHHSGNTMHMRMLRAMAQRAPGSRVAAVTDRRRIAEGIERFPGRTLAAFEPELQRAAEVDYLGAGCRRGAIQPLLRQ